MGRTLCGTLLFLALAACAGSSDPLPPDELAKYQMCSADTDCVLATNAPTSCCAQGGGGNTAINKDQVDAFRDAFDNPDCKDALCAAIAIVGPPTDPAWVDNKFVPKCTSNRCELIVHDHAWDQCDAMMSCPQDYECRAFTMGGFTNSYCWFVASM